MVLKDELNDNNFIKLFELLTLNRKIESYSDKKFILSCAITYWQHANMLTDDKKNQKTLRELSYYIILKYSIIHNDYRPLYDFSINFGFYPIARTIIENNLIKETSQSIHDVLADASIEPFKYDNKILIREQKKFTDEILDDDISQNQAYIAPTSYAKSELIIRLIEKRNKEFVAIIVPSKSLLRQTANLIKNSISNNKISKGKYKILLHDEMYDKTTTTAFIAIFTQERALRFLQRHSIPFDLLIIDEAHNIFDDNSRSYLLARLKKLCLQKNDKTKIVYLSPLIGNIDNLKIENQGKINAKTISFSIKECEFYIFKKEKISIYNRFLDKELSINDNSDFTWDSYIRDKSGLKNFLYINSPPKIEKFAMEFSEKINTSPKNTKLEELSKLIARHTHDDFYLVNLINNGVIYLHAKIPDDIKEFLITQFAENKDLKYVFANTVILEGINLSIDTMFLLDLRQGKTNLTNKSFINLIGRVNRLNSIFNDTPDFKKLTPQIHGVAGVINSDFLKWFKKWLTTTTIEDIVENPLLENCKEPKDVKERKKQDDVKKEAEETLNPSKNTLHWELKKCLIDCDLYRSLYKEPDEILNDIAENIKSIRLKLIKETEHDKINSKFFTMMQEVFFHEERGWDKFSEYKLGRLEKKETRDYYEKTYFTYYQQNNKDRINHLVKYLQERKNGEYENGKKIEFDYPDFFYVGAGYGNVCHPKAPNRTKDYINLLDDDCTYEKLVNIAIVKLKMEDDFVSFHLSKFANFFLEQQLFTQEEFNMFVYSSDKNEKHINLVKQGLPLSLISFLGNEIDNIEINDTNITSNEKFYLFYSNKCDDFEKFKIRQYIDDL